MKRVGVIGDPVKHSLSPDIHSYWLEKYGVEGHYDAVHIPAGQVEASLPILKQKFSGFNVTLPHKEVILPLCDEVDPAAQAIGAVNTVSIHEGKAYGFNTDAFGFIENLKEQWPDLHRVNTALVLGAGGAARAVLYALIEAGVNDIVLCNRSRDKAQALAAASFCTGKVSVLPWDGREKALPEVGLIVNTTSLGMTGQAALEMDLSGAPRNAGVCDVVYRPLMTPLLKTAEGRGMTVITGLGMLLHQARPAFQRWFGVMPDIDDTLTRMIEEAAK